MASETPGNALMTLVDLLGLDAPLSAFTDYLRRQRGLRTRGDFYIVAGVEEMLAGLNGRYRLAVVTTRGLGEAETFLAQYGLGDVFEVLVTRESTRRLKPHPAPILHAARLLGVPVERCVMVGDTTMDIKAARRAGAWAVAVLCGFGEREELERAGAHVILEHTAHLSSLLSTSLRLDPFDRLRASARSSHQTTDLAIRREQESNMNTDIVYAQTDSPVGPVWVATTSVGICAVGFGPGPARRFGSAA
jgi:HAD superfamily hydrolase (TIGR01549 family)